MKREELLALAERVEAATGADRRLDAEISALLRIEAVPQWAKMWAGEWRANSDGTVHMVHTDGSLGPHLKAREWTASLDAAMGLVPDEHRVGVLHHVLAVIQQTGFPHSTFLHRLTVGIVAAALRALAAQEDL